MASAQSSDGDSDIEDVEGATQQAPGDEAAFSNDESVLGDENDDDDGLPTRIQPPPQVGRCFFGFDVTGYCSAIAYMIILALHLLCFGFLT